MSFLSGLFIRASLEAEGCEAVPADKEDTV